MRRYFVGIVVVGAALGMPSVVVAAEIESLVRQLDAAAYRQREQAAAELAAADVSNAERIVAAAKDGSLETIVRTVQIFGGWAQSPLAPRREAGIHALEQLAVSANPHARRAQRLLIDLRSGKQWVAIERLRMMGAHVDTVGEVGAAGASVQVTLGRDWEGVPESIEALADITQLTRLNLSGSGLGHAALPYLERLPHLTALNLSGEDLTPGDFAQVGKLTQLRELNLAETPLDDAGAAALKTLVHLEKLDLHGAHLTDDSLPLLAALPGLRELNLTDAGLTPALFQRLRPNVRLIAE